jgi:hypothetical protein
LIRRVLLTMLLAAAGSATAQDVPQQTVEGAHRFLSVLSEQRQLVIIASGSQPMANYWVDRAEGDDCATVFKVSPRAYQRIGQPRREIGQAGFSIPEFAAVIEKHAYPQPPFAIDWSRAGAVSLNPLQETGLSQVLVVMQGTRYVSIYVVDATLAARALKAAQFLKAACDQTAETGF